MWDGVWQWHGCGSASLKDYNYLLLTELDIVHFMCYVFLPWIVSPMNIFQIGIWLQPFGMYVQNWWHGYTLLFYYLLQTNLAKWSGLLKPAWGKWAASSVFSNAVREAKQIRTTGRGHRVQSGQLQRVEAVFPEGECGCVMDDCWTTGKAERSMSRPGLKSGKFRNGNCHNSLVMIVNGVIIWSYWDTLPILLLNRFSIQFFCDFLLENFIFFFLWRFCVWVLLFWLLKGL